MEKDCSPVVGERLGGGFVSGAANGSLLIAKTLVSMHSDMNRYVVVCLLDYRGNAYEYVVWTMSANEKEYLVESGSYTNSFSEAGEIFDERCGKVSVV